MAGRDSYTLPLGNHVQPAHALPMRNLPRFGRGDFMKKNSSDWCKHFGIDRHDIMDPDGWDRWNFDASWAEAIDMQEFLRRLRESTVVHTPAIGKAIDLGRRPQ